MDVSIDWVELGDTILLVKARDVAAAARGGDGVQLPLRTYAVPEIVILCVEYSPGRAAWIVDR